MTENTSNQLERTSKGSLSFPYTRTNEFSASKSGGISSRIRFKPVRSDVLMRELLKEENSPKAENNTSKVTVHCDMTEHKEKSYYSICNEDECSTDILDTTLIDDDSVACETKDLMNGIAWLDKTPIENEIIDDSQLNLFSKLSINDNDKTDPKLEQKSNDNVYQELSEYLFKTPSFKNYKVSTTIANNNVPPRMQFATASHNDSIISSSNPQLLSVKKKIVSYDVTPKREVFKTNDTPKQHIQNDRFQQQTPRSNIQTNFSNNKANIILREKNMNIVTHKAEQQIKKDIQVIDTPKNDKNVIIKIAQKNVDTFEQNKEPVVTPTIEKNKALLENPKKKDTPTNPPVSCTKQVVPYTSQTIPESTFKSLKIRGKEYIIINKLGEGGSGQVYRCLEQDTMQDRAVKVVNLAVDAHTAASYINEVKLLKDLQGNDRVIKMFDYEQQNQNLFVVMEKGDVDFSVFLRNITTECQIQRHIIICYWIEMLKCVNEIHKNGIIHSDLKPSNFLLVGGRLKLIDFGIASKVSGDMTSVIKNEQVGTFNYISPEALLDSRDCPTEGKPRIRISYKSDVWSLGCILYQLVYRRTPFHNFNTWMTKVVTIIDRNHRIDYPAIKGIPPQLIQTIEKCLTYDMKNRPNVEELLNMYYNGNY